MNLNSKLFILILIASFSLSAQTSDTTYWSKGGFGSVTFSRVAIKNWAGGGQSSVSVNGVVNLFADYKKARTSWENSLDLGYGLIRQGNKGSLVKSDDKINYVSKFGYQIEEGNKKWLYSGLLDFRTQFAEGLIIDEVSGRRNVVISKFMAPAYVTIGLGLDYKPNDAWSFNYIPLTGKFTIVNDQTLADAGAFGVPDGNKARGEFGSYLRIKFTKDVVKNVNVDSRLELFSNYVKDFPTVDVNWQNAVVMKVNEFLTANFFYQLIYDKDISGRVQQKSVFGVGLSKSFGAKRG
ncbi:MAG: DUF3078 domain-containing protein [Cyclobacteriaceae bacterium]